MTAGHLSAKQRDANLAATYRLDPSWKSEALRVVAFGQESGEQADRRGELLTASVKSLRVGVGEASWPILFEASRVENC